MPAVETPQAQTLGAKVIIDDINNYGDAVGVAAWISAFKPLAPP